MIGEAIENSCIVTHQEEEVQLQEIMAINEEMRTMRDSVNNYVSDGHGHDEDDPLQESQYDENVIQRKFNSIEARIASATRCRNQIYDKLQKIYSMRQCMEYLLPGHYQVWMNRIQQRETEILLQSAERAGDAFEMPNVEEIQREFKIWCRDSISLSPIIQSTFRGLNRGKLLVFGYIARAQQDGDITRNLAVDVVSVICEYVVLEECFEGFCIKIDRAIA